jgi:hypothetical protein
MAGGKDPSLMSRSGKHLETAVSISQARADVGAVGFDPTRGGEMPWRQPGISPRDHRTTSNVPSAAQGYSQVYNLFCLFSHTNGCENMGRLCRRDLL